MIERIDSATRIGDVALQVSDLDRSVAFYVERIGFQLFNRQGDSATLGVGATPLLQLKALPGARKVSRTSGLYHFAILTPSRLDLAKTFQHLLQTQTRIGGASDHLVSEALYLDDPDGNGIEIYRDRPRDEWPRLNGSIQMATDPFDAEGVLAELKGHEDEPWSRLADGTTIGHVHLHVGSIPKAEAFYVGLLGFDVIFTMPSALFVSAGGYHHHLGLNTWAGVGAPPAPPDAVGLRYFTVILPSEDTRNTTVERLQAAGVSTETVKAGILVRDPFNNAIVLTVA